ncbi:SirB2 family protein [Sphingomonas rhizophila]|uniref:SirB2 family protein n=2 Tax=Sphingomonas rhizophila TaxID=2071607 RepID=A0A7G9SEK1_9SPHN|nr:SirB2 family protein [Sphingomonas rhizophila]
MDEFYLPIRHVHIGAVALSGALFLVRTIGHNFLGATWPKALPLRILVWSVDMVLLTAALMLTTIVQQYPFVDGWLTMKVVLLVLYIMLGTWAFRAEKKSTRLWSMAAALAVFGFIITVARAHDPLGLLATI